MEVSTNPVAGEPSPDREAAGRTRAADPTAGSDDAVLARLADLLALTDSVPVGIFRSERGHGNVYVNQRLAEITGRRVDDLLGDGWVRIVHPDDRARVERERQEALQERRELVVEYRILRPGGDARWVRVRSSLAFDHDGVVSGSMGAVDDITDRVVSESSTARLRAICELTPAFVLLADRNERVRFANHALRVALGLRSDGELATLTLRDVYTPSSYERWDRDIRPALEAGSSWSGELQLLGAGGVELAVAQASTAHAGADGSIDCFSIFGRDVTKERARLHDLAESESRLRAVVEHAADFITLHDSRGTIVAAGGRVEEVLGLAEDDLVGVGEFSFVAGDRQLVAEAFAAVVAEGAGARRDIGYWQRGADGSPRWIESRLTNLLDDPAVRAVIVLSWDQHERKRAVDALQESEQRFRSLAEASPVAVLYTDTEGRIQYANERWHDITGQPVAAIDFSLVHPDDRERVAARARSATIDGQPFREEFRLVGADGRLHHLRASTAPVHSDSGALIGFVGTVDDVTAEHESRAITERLAALLEATTDSAVITGADGRILHMNRGAFRLLALDPEARVVGSDVNDILRYPKWAWAIVSSEMMPALERDGIWSGELAVLDTNGNEVPISQVALAHRSPTGDLEFYSMIARDIRELKHAEEELAASEAWYRTLVQHATDLVTVRDGDLRLTYVSPSAREMLGVEPSELLGSDDVGVDIHPDDQALVMRTMRDARARFGETLGMEYRVRHHGLGAWRTFHSRITNLLDDPVVAGIVTNSHDVTEQRAEEAARTLSESNLLAVIESSPLAIFAVDLDGRVQLWSRACEEMFGWTSQEVLGELLPWATPDAHPEFDAWRKRAFAGETVRDLELSRLGRDGTPVTVSLSAAPVRDADGSVERVVVVAADVTDEQRAETGPRASEERFRSLVQHSSDLVLVYGPDRTITYVSPAVTPFGGYVVGDSVGQRQSVHPEDEALVEQMFSSIEEPGTTSARFEVRFQRTDGVYRRLEMIATNLLEDRNVGGIVVNARDVTERADALAALRETNEALAESEARYRALVQHATDMVTVIDADGTVRYTSPAAERVMGYPSGWGVGMDALAILHPDDAERVSGMLAGAREESGVTGPVSFRLRHADGSYRIIEAFSNNLLDDPDVHGLVITARDVTERTQAAEALFRSEERLRALVQNLSDVITVVDASGELSYTSPASTRLFGYSDHDSTWTNPLGFVHPDDVERVTTAFQEQLSNSPSSEPVRFRLQHADGTWRYVEAIANDLLHDPAVEGIVVTTRDITERTRAEATIADQARVLELIAQGAPLSDTLAEACRLVEAHVPGARCAVMLVDREGGRPHLGAASGAPEGFLRALVDGPAAADDATPGGAAAVHGERVVVEEIATDARWAEHWTLADAYGLQACWSTPIVASEGDRLLGSFDVYHEQPHVPSEDETKIVDVMVHLATIAIERRAFEDRLAHQAHHDPLTGLPNRVLFLEFLELAMARGRRHRTAVAVLFLDLDRFKVVNDSLGHDAGDELLVSLATRLKGVVRPGDTIARFGGDEFTVLCEDLSAGLARQQAIEVAERLLGAVGAPFELEPDEAFLSASVGIAVARGPDDRPEGLLRDADAAMYRAKERGKGRWEVFDEAMRAIARERLETESALHRAIDRNEFVVYYQPVISLQEHRCVGVEALVRWHHPERGLVSPQEFITLAEETGLIVPLGSWVLEAACRQIAEWSDDPRLADLIVSVNLSARQLAQADLIDSVAHSIARTGVDPGRVCLEMTESILMDERTIGSIKDLKAIGVRLSIDDFGTGYSSLGYLKRFPVDSVKIDRSFVDGLAVDPEDSAIVAAVVSLGHALGLDVVAEGVESRTQLRALVELGCDQAQGFLFAPPAPGPITGDRLSNIVDWMAREEETGGVE